MTVEKLRNGVIRIYMTVGPTWNCRTICEDYYYYSTKEAKRMFRAKYKHLLP